MSALTIRSPPNEVGFAAEHRDVREFAKPVLPGNGKPDISQVGTRLTYSRRMLSSVSRENS